MPINVLRLRPTASPRDGREFDLGLDVARHCQLLSDERHDRICTGFDGPPPQSTRPEARCLVDTMAWRTSALRPPKCTTHAPRHAHEARPGLAVERWVERLLRMRWPTSQTSH